MGNGRKRTRPLRKRPRVALIVETSLSYGRRVLSGIAQYVSENGPWSIYVEQRSVYDPAPDWLRGWRGDGIISRAAYPQLAKLVVDTRIPTVDLNEQVIGLGLPLIYNDHPAIGRMAAHHLIERGFTHYGFCGYPDISWSDGRCAGFARTVEQAGFTLNVYQSPEPFSRGYQPVSWDKEQVHLAAWIAALPKPAGLLACNDFRAIQVLDACREAGAAVPEQVAVIGVDNEVVACELASPPLTSVVPDAFRIGYEAASLLDQLMQGRKPRISEVYIQPTGVVARQSTDITCIPDAEVAQAMRFIRDHACDGINVADVLDHVPTSRSTLQRKFRKWVRRSLHEEIMQVRLRRVRELLERSDMKLADIARRAGFDYVEHMATAFRVAMRMTPGQYRNTHRRPGPATEGDEFL